MRPSGSLGKLKSIALIIAFYGAAYLIINFVHNRFLTVRVVLYDALLDTALAGFATLAFYILWMRTRSVSTKEEISLSLVVGCLLATLYSVAVPTVIDRSLSIYIIEKLAQRGGSIRRSAFDEILKREFFPEHQLVDIRLTEQLNSGTITISNGCVRLTPRGARIASFTRFYRTQLLPRRREINGRFTDDLTDPFRKSKIIVPFECDPVK